MLDRGLLIKTERGALQTYDFQGDCVEIDVFNPETRKYVWEVCKKNYYDFGIDAFWLATQNRISAFTISIITAISTDRLFPAAISIRSCTAVSSMTA